MHKSIGHCVRVGEQKKEVTTQGWTRITKQTNKQGVQTFGREGPCLNNTHRYKYISSKILQYAAAEKHGRKCRSENNMATWMTNTKKQSQWHRTGLRKPFCRDKMGIVRFPQATSPSSHLIKGNTPVQGSCAISNVLVIEQNT